MLIELLFALLAALLVTAVFAVGFRRTGPWTPLWSYFLVIFMAVWAAALWLRPAGPALWGVYWVPLLFMALVVALVLAAAEPRVPPAPEIRPAAPEEPVRATGAVLGMFFWFLLAALLLAILAGYYLRETALLV